MPARLICLLLALFTTHCSQSPLLNLRMAQTPGAPYLPQLDQDPTEPMRALGHAYQLASTPQWQKTRQYLRQTPPPYLQPYHTLIQATLDLYRHRSAIACQRLKTIDPEVFPTIWQAHYFNRLATCHVNLQQLGAALKALSKSPHAQSPAYQLKLWKTLYNASTQARIKARQTLDDTTLRGWIDLVDLATRSATLAPFPVALARDWQAQYPEHPGQTWMHLDNTTPPRPLRIGLLLPTTGALASAGLTLQRALFSAYYQLKPLNIQQPQVLIPYNTDESPLPKQLHQAQKDGITHFIGPVSQIRVSELSQQPQLPPTLALNTSQNTPPQVMGFNLRVETQGQQLADYAFSKGARHALLFASPGTKHARIQAALIARWRAIGGKSIEAVTLNNFKQPLLGILRKHLGIQDSLARAHLLKTQLNLSKVRFIPQRRQDIDSIFLIMEFDEAKKTLPLLKYFYVGNLPIYAGSSISSGLRYGHLTRDLDGITFCDAPWVLSALTHRLPNMQAQPASQALLKRWPKTISNKQRFTAIGLDAYHLSLAFEHLKRFPYAFIQGATGQLYQGPQRRIERQLSWGTIQKGTVHWLNPPNTSRQTLT